MWKGNLLKHFLSGTGGRFIFQNELYTSMLDEVSWDKMGNPFSRCHCSEEKSSVSIMNNFLVSFHFIFSMVYFASVIHPGQAPMSKEELDTRLGLIFDFITRPDTRQLPLSTVRQRIGQSWPTLGTGRTELPADLNSRCSRPDEQSELTNVVLACFFLRYYHVQHLLNRQAAAEAASATIETEHELFSIFYPTLVHCERGVFTHTTGLIKRLISEGFSTATQYTLVEQGKCSALGHGPVQQHLERKGVFQRDCWNVLTNPGVRPVWLVMTCDVVSKYYWKIFSNEN